MHPLSTTANKTAAHPRQSYNASSCGRWIRALQTALASLYKTNAAKSGQVLTTNAESHSSLKAQSDAEEESEDVEHFFGHQARSRITYNARRLAESSKARRAKAFEATPKRVGSGVILPTPFKQVMQEGPQPLSIDPKATGQLVAGNLKPSLNTLKTAGQASVEAFERLLRATTPNLKADRTGPKSLLSVAIHNLPSHVEHETALRRAIDPDDREDVILEVIDWIDELTEITSLTGVDLAEATRQLGTSLICQAIADDMLGFDLLQVLIIKCSDAGAAEAVDSILSAHIKCRVSKQENNSASSNESRSEALSAADDIRKLLDLSDDGISPLKHLGQITGHADEVPSLSASRQIIQSRQLAIKTVILHKAFWPDALSYLESSLLSACGTRVYAGAIVKDISEEPAKAHCPITFPCVLQDAVLTKRDELWRKYNNVLSDTCLALISMAILGQAKAFGEGTHVDHTLPLRAIRGASQTLMRAYRSDASIQRAVSLGFHIVASSIIMVDLLTVLLGLVPGEEQDVNTDRNHLRLQYIIKLNTAKGCSSPAETVSIRYMTNLVRDLALTCEAHLAGKGFEVLQLATSMFQAAVFEDNLEANAARQMALDAALAFAMKMPAPQHTTFADEFERLCQNGTHSLTIDQASEDAMRWDNGLCEWVMRSHHSGATRKRKADGISATSVDLDHIDVLHKPAANAEVDIEGLDIDELGEDFIPAVLTPKVKRPRLDGRPLVDGASDEDDDEDELALGFSTRKMHRPQLCFA